MTKQEQIKDLEARMLADTKLPLSTNLVIGEGSLDCKVMFIGEAPGAEEDRLKRPFVGRSGQLLNKMLESIGWKREDVYISNIVKRRPPDNRDPLPEEIAAYRPYLAEQIHIIDPKIIAPLGRFSMNYFLPLAKITRDQGKPFPLKDKIIFPLFHPAAVLRGTVPVPQYEESFRKLKELVENPKDESDFGPF